MEFNTNEMLDVWTLMSVTIFLTLWYYLSTWIKVVIAISKMPSPPCHPLLGHALLSTDSKKLKAIVDTAYQDFGSLIKVWLSAYPLVAVLAPPDIQTILCSFKHTDKLLFYTLMDDYLGQGLVTISGYKWKLHRKLIQPTFHLSVLETFIEAFHRGGNRLALTFKETTGPINITSHINKCILDILNEAVLGISPEETDKLKADEKSPFRNAKVSVPYRLTRPWLLFSCVYSFTDLGRREEEHRNSLNNFMRKVIRQKQEEKFQQLNYSEHGAPRSLLDRLIEISECNEDFNENDIVEEVCTFLLAGQESVSTATAFCLYLLAKHQDVQQQVQEELDEVLKESENVPTINDLKRLLYLEQCIKETLRLYPSIPLIGRKLTEDVRLGKYNLPAGCNVFISPYITHRIQEIYPDPEKFDPERFTKDKEAIRHPYAYFPFSAGPRNCIGYKFAILEMKTILSLLLKKYSISLSTDHKDFTLTYRVTLRASGGIWISFSSRDTVDLH